MSKINLLTSKVYNRIAAGEVVDRPYSIVKELVENSIDSGAKNITVEVIDGGKTSVKVEDDGCGMDRVDILNSIKAHATSKIKTTKDLDCITTLGFRGEALASIASVSKLTIISKTNGKELGSKLYCEGGENVTVEDYGSAVGTQVIVNNLFFNTPVREKFLRSVRAEEGEISSLIVKFILGNPDLSFKYLVNGKIIYQSFGDGIEAAMAQVFGAGILKDCFCIDTQKNGLEIKGYISKHYFTKGNRTHQFIYLNGRCIQNQTISAAILNAYSNYLMRGRFPFYVLSVSVPNEIVDVNVHPNKSDVRFSNNQIIYSSIYSVISKVLDGTEEALNIMSKSRDINEILPDIISDNKVNDSYRNVVSTSAPNKITFEDSIQQQKISNDDIFNENKKFLEELEKGNKPIVAKDIFVPNKKVEQFEVENIDENITIIGQALNTYLILQAGNDLLFVDQHAAHERLLYDKLIASFNSRQLTVQPLLIPYMLNVSGLEYDFILSKKQILIDMGFDIDEFGTNSFRVSSLPAIVSTMNLDNFFNLLLSDLNQLKNVNLTDVLADSIAQKACKAAIKSGDKLDNAQIEMLINILKGNLGLKCPHGRPVVVRITRTEIDKWFKRIL